MSVTETAEVHESDAFSVLGEALESAAETFGDLTASAGDTARSAAQGVSSAVGEGVYKGSYGLAFGVVFSAVFLTELLPAGNAIRRGLEDGANSALETAARRRSAHASEPEELTEDEPPAPPSRPGRPRRVATQPAEDV